MSTFKQFALLAITVGSGLFLAGCEPKTAKAPVQPDLVSIALAPSMATVQIGATQPLSVTGTFSDSSTASLTYASIFLTSDPTVALVSAAGVVTAKKAGTATITATHTASGKTATAAITVPAPALVSIAITPKPVNLVAGTTQQLTVTGTYSDASTAVLTTGLTFSPNNAYATVSNSGLVTAVAAGTTTVTVTDTASGYMDTVDVIVTAASGGNTALITFDEVPPPTLTDFGTNGAPPVIAADPAGGSNQVLKVFKYALPSPGSEQWAGVTVSTGANASIPAIPFTATDKTMTVRVYSPAVGVRVRLKVEDASNVNVSCETDAITTTAAAWETLTFNFANPGLSPPVGGGATSPLDLTKTYNKISIFSDFGIGNGGSGPLPADRVYYYDDITFVGTGGGGGGGTAPTTAAPTPPARAAADVLSIYSDAYTQVANVNLFPNWGQSTVVSEVQVAGNNTEKYTNLNYEGIDWAANPIDVSAMSMLHIDFWTADVTSLKVSIISAGLENPVTLTPAAGWNSVDIDLTQYTVPDKSAIIQIKIEGTPVGGTLYLDNLYFWRAAGGGGGTAPTTAAPTPPARAAADVLSIYSDAYTQIANVNLFPNWGQSTVVSEVQVAGNNTEKYTNLNYEGIDWAASPINVSAMSMLHIDFWTADVTSLKVSIISAGLENPVTLTPGAGWNSVDIDLAQYTVPDKTAIIQIKIEGTPVGGTLYLDNLYFWRAASVSCGTTAPTCAPATPTAAASGVTSLYSEAYTTPVPVAAVFNPFPNWGQATQYSEVTIASNKSLQYTMLNYEGIDWVGAAIDVSTKGTVHFDLWSPDLATVKVFLISTATAQETGITVTLTAGTWNSVDIPLNSFTAPDLTRIDQIKFDVQPASGTLYVDNIYFWGTPAVAACTVMGCGGPVTIPVATASDQFGFILAGDAIFAADYIGPVDGLGNHALFAGATTTGAASGGSIGYFDDPLMSTSSQKVDLGGWVSGSIDQLGVPNFFRYFILTAPASTFASSYMGLYANSPSNGTVNVSAYASIKIKLWGPASMYEQQNFNPTIEMVLAGPLVPGCVATGSGGTEISKTFVANQKIGAGSSYKLPLATGWSVKGLCGADTNLTAVAAVLANLARVVVTVPGSSFNFINPDAGTQNYATGVNLGPIAFTNN